MVTGYCFDILPSYIFIGTRFAPQNPSELGDPNQAFFEQASQSVAEPRTQADSFSYPSDFSYSDQGALLSPPLSESDPTGAAADVNQPGTDIRICMLLLQTWIILSHSSLFYSQNCLQDECYLVEVKSTFENIISLLNQLWLEFYRFCIGPGRTP